MDSIRKLLFLPSTCLVLAACQGTSPSDLGRNQSTPPTALVAAALTPGDGGADVEEFEVCKHGSSADFAFTIDDQGTLTQGTFSLVDGECTVVVLAGGAGVSVTVTETSAHTGFHFDHAVVTTVTGVNCVNPVFSTSSQTSPTVSGTTSGSSGDGVCDGTLAEFFNVGDTPLTGGRMTGGGRQITVGGVKITRGFTIHCDIILSNNLEINWPGHKWHLTKPLTSATCIDDPAIDPTPPPAPFDTFIGEGLGKLDGVGGSFVRFTFIDAGEPGGKNDKAQIQIYSGGDPSTPLVLDVPLSLLDNGNLQAHFDQPHK